jgi:hypothetical protein
VNTLAPAPDQRPELGGQAGSWPLSPIEELDWYLENPGEPSLVQLQTQVRGHLDQSALARATARVLAADPAARRRLAPSSPWRRHLRWEVAPPGPPDGADAPLTVAAWTRPDELDALRESLTTTAIPLHQRALRLTLAVGPDSDWLFLQVHHAAFDGVSALALLAAIAAAYRDIVGAPATEAPPADAPGVPASDTRGFPRDSDGNRADGEAAAAPGFPGTVIRIAPRMNGPARPGYGCARWTAPVPRPARDGAGPRTTVNDLLVTALILTIDRWNAAQASRPSGRRISISVPVTIRDAQDRWSGAGNQSRLIRITARHADCERPADLLARVADEVRAARHQPRPGLDGASRLLATGWAPTGLKRAAVRLARDLAAPLCTDTALASNLGGAPAMPSLRGTGTDPIWFSGPAPMPRGLSLCALTVGGRLHLAIAYSLAKFDPAAAADFAAVYRQALGELAPEAETPEAWAAADHVGAGPERESA